MHLIAIVHLAIAIAFAAHALKTGRSQYWLFILLFMPLIGSIAYVSIELMPELFNSYGARNTARNILKVVDRDHDLRQRRNATAEVDSVSTKLDLAEVYESKQEWRNACSLYQSSAQGLFADDPRILSSLARCQLELGDLAGAEETLTLFQNSHPRLQHAPAHLAYARLEEAKGDLQSALREYDSVSRYFVGLEARTRHALLLKRLGEPVRARAILDSVIKASRARGIVLSPADVEWLKVARENL